MDPRRTLIFRWLGLGALLIAAMVCVGGITRLTGSGLSITEWRPVTGAIPPLTEQDWLAEFAKYQASPQFKLVNTHFSLAEFKNIFWWEWAHRLLGRLIGLFFTLPLALFWLRGWLEPWLRTRLLVLVGLGGMQGLVGWLMVASGLVDKPWVSHFRLGAHLLMALLTLAVTVWTALQVRYGREAADVRPRARWAWTVLGLLTLQILYGAFVAGLRAGYLFNTFPTMGGEWVPAGFLDLSPAWRNLLENAISIQFVHRWLAMVVLAAIWLVAWRRRAHPLLAVPTRVAAAVALAQVLLGVTTILFFPVAPVVLGSLHQLTAVALFASVVVVVFRAERRELAVVSVGQPAAAPAPALQS